ncbi:hypothetical protein J6590_030719 [Homalodisca vitripennis]|nr:hypothetical protein J6590_030719 [Homalodisca vitripennis]
MNTDNTKGFLNGGDDANLLSTFHLSTSTSCRRLDQKSAAALNATQLLGTYGLPDRAAECGVRSDDEINDYPYDLPAASPLWSFSVQVIHG